MLSLSNDSRMMIQITEVTMAAPLTCPVKISRLNTITRWKVTVRKIQGEVRSHFLAESMFVSSFSLPGNRHCL